MSGSTTNNVVYFTTTATSGSYPAALWVSDGTSSGTQPVSSYSSPLGLIGAFSFDGVFAFLVTEPGETEIDGTLGTPASTRPFSFTTDIPAGPITATSQTLQSQYAFLNSGTLIGGLGLGFGADVVESNFTDLGTNVLLTLSAQSFLSPEYVTDFTAFGGDVYFLDGNADGVSNLYVTDGTTPGTVKLFSAPLIDNLTLATNAATGQRLFFGEIAASGDGELAALAASATAATTIFDFGAGVTVDSITNADNELFIVTNSGTNVGLWVSDASNNAPTEIGTFTALPQQVTPAADGSAQVFFQLGNEVLAATSSTVTVLGSFAAVGSLYAMGSDLYFAANDGVDGMQLWQSDGTPSGTTMVTDINPGPGFAPAEFTSLNGELYFTATDGAGGAELWESDGTTAGTTLVDNVAPGASGVTITSIVPGPSLTTAPTGALVTYNQTYSESGSYGSTDGTLAGTQSGLLAPPGALSFSIFGTALTISHGSPDTTLSVALAPTSAVLAVSPVLAAGPGGDFIAFTTIDYGPTYSTDSGDYTWNSLLYFIGDTSITPVLVGNFVPSAEGEITQIFDLVNGGSLEYFLLQPGSGDTQLWSSDGTAADTTEVADLGTVLSNPTTQNPAVSGSLGWAALLANGSGDISLYTVTGTAITPADIGLSGTTFDASVQPLAEDNGLYFLSVTNGASVEAIATNGTTATVLATEATSLSSGFGDFTVSGTLVYFDDGSNGALYVSDGTAAGTTQLLASGALIAPYAAAAYGAQAVTPSTVSVSSDGTTWFYFAATQSGGTGLYRTDGTTVQQIVASGVATNPDLVASNGLVFFVAAGASGTTTVWYTDPTTMTAQPVISSTEFLAGSFLADAYGPPQNPTDLQAATAYPFAPDTYFLTTGADTITGGAGDTAIYAYAGDLNAGDTVDGGGGINDLYLVGPGSFDLSAPATLTDITQVLYGDDGQTITLRPGTSIDVHLPSGDYGGTGATIIGAANSDVIDANGTADTVIVGGPQETVEYAVVVTLSAADAAASIEYAGTLDLVGGGSFDLTSAYAGTMELAAPTTLTLDASSGSGVIIGSSGADTITINSPYGDYAVEGKGGADVFNLATASDTFTDVPSVEFYDTAADLNGVTITGFNFAPSPYGFDDIDITDFAYSSAEKVSYANGTLTVDEFGNGQTVITMDVPGAPAAGGFVAAGDGASGTLLKFYPQVFTLTTGADTIDGTTLNVILGTEDTLNAGDTINGGAYLYSNIQSTLELLGAGNFDLSAPATLTGLSAVIGDTTGEQIGGTTGLAQTITLRNGFSVPITLGPGHDTVYGADNAEDIYSVPENYSGTQGDTVYLGDARENVQLEGVPADVVYTDAATGGASVSDDLEGSFSTTGTLAVIGGGVVGLGNADVAIVTLAVPTELWLTGDVPRVIQGSTGTDRIDTGIAPSGFGGLVTIEPDGGADTVVAPLLFSMLLSGTGAQLDGTTIDAFNFLPTAADTLGLTTPDTIDITDMPYSPAVSLAFAAGTLSVDNAGSTVTFLLPGAPNVGSFVATTDGASGTDITYVAPAGGSVDNATIASGATGFIGSPGNDTLTVDAGALAAGQTIDGEGGNNELVLSGTGDFDLSAPAVLADFQALTADGSNQTITLRPGLTLDMTLFGTGDTLIGADSPDPIVLDGYSTGNTIIVNNPSATVIDQGGYNTIEVSAASAGANIYGGSLAQDQLVVTGGGTAVMGDNIFDIAQADLAQSGLWFQANALPDLSIVLNGTSGAPPDTVIAGSGGDTIDDFSPGRNILAGGAGNDLFVLGSIGVGLIPTPTGDTFYDFDASGNDTIDFAVVEQGTVSYDAATGTLTLTGLIDPTGSVGTVSVDLAGSYNGTFSAFSDNAYGTDVVFSGTTSPTPVPCYCRGTRIAVPGGETAVEALRIGDLVTTAAGAARPIRWIGRRSYTGRFATRNRHTQPVLIRRGALAGNMPKRDLYVSPNHAMYLDGVLIPAIALVNGTSIVQRQAVDQVDYFHLELDAHDIVLAEGAPAETFVDDHSRGMFHNAGEYWEQYPEAVIAPARYCAPRVEDGEELEAVHRRLARRASGRPDGAAAAHAA